MFEIIKKLNWLDLLVVIVFIRIGCVALKNSLAVELFKALGTLFAGYLSLHYFNLFSDSLRGRLPLKNVPLDLLDFFSLLILAVVGYLVFAILREAFLRLIKLEANPQIDRWGSLVIGVIRAYLLSGLIVFMLVASTVTYFQKSVKAAYSGGQLFKVTPSVYSGLWHGLATKFMSKEKFNPTVKEIEENFSRK